MRKIKRNTGITIISVIITIIVILILTSVTITSTQMGTEFRGYSLMCADIELLEDKILMFYKQYGELPTGDLVVSVASGIDNGHEFYEVDTNKLKNITLNYGDEEDIYIVDSITFEVYYLNGIEYDGRIYYTDT